MRVALGYTRVSGQAQTNGTGPDRQRETIGRYAQAGGYEVARYYDEAYTGTESDRPQLAMMIHDALTEGATTIIVERMDRLARDLSVQMHLLTHFASRGLTLIDATTGQDVTAAVAADPMMRALIQIQGVFAELDRRLTVEKLRRARAMVRERTGRCEGRKPFGTRPGEQTTLERMKALNDGSRTWYGIAKSLTQAGLRSRSGKPWTATAVKRILGRQ